jgi:hypothetical protein
LNNLSFGKTPELPVWAGTGFYMGLRLYKPQFEGVFMNRKISVIAFALFLLMTVGVYAQNISLREGYYQTQGFPDHIFIAPNSADSGRGNTPENAFKTQRGSYGALVWAGLPESANVLWVGTGNIVGNEFRINVDRRSSSNMGAKGIDVPKGTLVIWLIVDNETFIDGIGQRWIWRRRR